jgi:hypothetical protein
VRQPLITAELVREPNNPYDPNAIRVEADCHVLAYVPKEDGPPLPRRHRQAGRPGSPSNVPSPANRWLGPRPRRPRQHRAAHPDGSPAHCLERTGRVPAGHPIHEHHEVHPLRELAADAWPKDKAIVTLVDAGSGALALRHGETWLGHIIGRPDLVAYIGRVAAASLPPTARIRVQHGRLVVPLADHEVTIVLLHRSSLIAYRPLLTLCARCRPR